MTTNKYITVAYKLYTPSDNGTPDLMEEATVEHPFQFVSGLKMTLDDFESQIEPLEKGDSFDFTLTPDQAYGPLEMERIVQLPRSAFEQNGKLDSRYIYEGAVVPLTSADGDHFMGTISEITATQITVDLNHPLAGLSLHFVGTVIENRDATNKEIEETLKVLSGECGGGCGGCGGSCGGCGSEGGCGGCGGGGCH